MYFLVNVTMALGQNFLILEPDYADRVDTCNYPFMVFTHK